MFKNNCFTLCSNLHPRVIIVTSHGKARLTQLVRDFENLNILEILFHALYLYVMMLTSKHGLLTKTKFADVNDFATKNGVFTVRSGHRLGSNQMSHCTLVAHKFVSAIFGQSRVLITNCTRDCTCCSGMD